MAFRTPRGEGNNSILGLAAAATLDIRGSGNAGSRQVVRQTVMEPPSYHPAGHHIGGRKPEPLLVSRSRALAAHALVRPGSGKDRHSSPPTWRKPPPLPIDVETFDRRDASPRDSSPTARAFESPRNRFGFQTARQARPVRFHTLDATFRRTEGLAKANRSSRVATADDSQSQMISFRSSSLEASRSRSHQPSNRDASTQDSTPAALGIETPGQGYRFRTARQPRDVSTHDSTPAALGIETPGQGYRFRTERQPRAAASASYAEEALQMAAPSHQAEVSLSTSSSRRQAVVKKKDDRHRHVFADFAPNAARLKQALKQALVQKFGSTDLAYDWFDYHKRGISRNQWCTGTSIILLPEPFRRQLKATRGKIFAEMSKRGVIKRKKWRAYFEWNEEEEGEFLKNIRSRKEKMSLIAGARAFSRVKQFATNLQLAVKNKQKKERADETSGDEGRPESAGLFKGSEEKIRHIFLRGSQSYTDLDRTYEDIGDFEGHVHDSDALSDERPFSGKARVISDLAVQECRVPSLEQIMQIAADEDESEVLLGKSRVTLRDVEKARISLVPNFVQKAEAILLMEDAKEAELKGVTALAYILTIKCGSLDKAYRWLDHSHKGHFASVQWMTASSVLHLDMKAITGYSPYDLYKMMLPKSGKKDGNVTRKAWVEFFDYEAELDDRQIKKLEVMAKTFAERTRTKVKQLWSKSRGDAAAAGDEKSNTTQKTDNNEVAASAASSRPLERPQASASLGPRRSPEGNESIEEDSESRQGSKTRIASKNQMDTAKFCRSGHRRKGNQDGEVMTEDGERRSSRASGHSDDSETSERRRRMSQEYALDTSELALNPEANLSSLREEYALDTSELAFNPEANLSSLREAQKKLMFDCAGKISKFDMEDLRALGEVVFIKCATGRHGRKKFLRKNDLQGFLKSACRELKLDEQSVQDDCEQIFDDVLELQVDMGAGLAYGLMLDYFRVFLHKVSACLFMTLSLLMRSLFSFFDDDDDET